MAETIGSLVVRVGLDGVDFNEGLKNIRSRMQLAKSELKAISSSFEDFGKTVDTLRIKQDNLAKMYRLQGERVRQLRNQYDQIVKAHGAESDAALRAAVRVNNAIAAYNRMGKELKDVTYELKTQESRFIRIGNGISSFANYVNTASNRLMSIGKTMTTHVTMPLAGIAAMAVRTGMEFDQEMSKVKAISGATGEEFDKLKNLAIELGAKTTKSASEVAAGMLEMAKAGFSVNQIMEAMPGLIAASEASGEDMARTTEVVTAALNGFGLEASKASHVADVLAEAANRTNADINDLGYAFKYAAPVAHTLGLSLEDVAAAAGLMANAGIKGEQAGTTLRMAMLRLADPPKDAANAIAQLGLKIKDSHGKMLPLRDIIAQLNEKTRDMTKTQKAAYISAIFGTEAMSGMIAAIDAGPAAFDRLKKALIESDGVAQRASKQMKDNFAGAVEQLKGTLESIGIQVSNELTPFLRSFTDWLTRMGEKFQNLSPEGKRLVIILGLIAAGFGPLTIGFAALYKSLGVLIGGVGKAIQWFGRWRASAAVTRMSITTLGNTAAVTAEKINAANVAMSTTSRRMTALRGGAMAAGTALTMFGGKWGTVLGIATMFLPEIMNAGKGLFNFAGRALGAIKNIGGFGAATLNVIKNIGNLSKILGVARIGFSALGGPIGLLTMIAIPALIDKGIKLYKHMREQTIPAINDFGNKVSQSTTRSILAYKKLNDEATVQLNYLYWSGTKISQQTATQLSSIFDKMANQIRTSMQNNFNKSYQSLNSFLQNSKSISAKEQQEILNNVRRKHEQEEKIVSQGQARIKQILEKAAKEKRSLTDLERLEINRIQTQMMNAAVKTMSKGELEQKIIFERLRNESKNITAHQAAEVVRNSAKARDGAVKEANRKYKETVAAIIRERDQTGSISKQQADKLIKEAKRQRDEAVKKAEDMHNKVVSYAKKQAKGQVDQIDWATGRVKTRWDKFVENTAKAINAVAKGLNWIAKGLDLKWRIPYWNPKKYAKGTPKSGHPGGPAIVGEKGPELAYIPKVGVTLLGTRGPELITDLPRGTAVLPNKQTEKLLKSYGFPGYEDGVGDFFSVVLKGPKSVLETVWKRFKPNISGFGGVLNQLAGGIINFLKDKTLDFIKNRLDDFFAIGDIKVGGKENVRKWILAAMAITGVPLSWLNPLITIAMRESGGNPRAINLWDINAKRGTPSKGLFQTIDPTFNRYKLPGLNNIWNPVHNAVAAIRYIIDRYGTVWNVPGIRNLMRGRGYVGYSEGTPTSGHPGGLAVVGEEGRELAYIPNKGFTLLGTEGPMLLDLPKGTAVLPNKETERLLKVFNIPGYADGVGRFPTIENYNDVDKLARLISNSIKESLEGLENRIIQIEIPVVLDGREIARSSYRYISEFQEKDKYRAKQFRG